MAATATPKVRKKVQRDEYGGVVTMLDGQGGDPSPDADPAKVVAEAPAKAPQAGGGGGEEDWLTSLFNAGGDAVQGVATGAGKQGARMVVGAGQMVNKALLPGISDAIQPGALDQASAGMAPQGVAEKLGAGAMHVGSVAGGAAATGGGSLLAQIGAGAAGSGLMEGANSGGDLKSMLMAAATGGAGRALTGARAMKAGVGALGEGGKAAAKARLPELMDEIALAQQKGAVPGHGMVPKVLAQERDELLRMLTEEAAPAAKSAVEGAPSNLEKVIGEAAKFFFPKTARVAGKLLGRN